MLAWQAGFLFTICCVRILPAILLVLLTLFLLVITCLLPLPKAFLKLVIPIPVSRLAVLELSGIAANLALLILNIGTGRRTFASSLTEGADSTK